MRAFSKTSTGARVVSLIGQKCRLAVGGSARRYARSARKRDLKAFIELPYRLRRDDPQWVPPLRFERRQFLDRDKNPWFDHAEAEFFLGERDGRAGGPDHRPRRLPLGRVPGRQRRHVRLLRLRATTPRSPAPWSRPPASWLRERGRERMLGPMDFTMNDECGILIEGFDEPSMILEPWHPPYYRELLEALGLSKAIDLLMWELWFGKLKAGQRAAPDDPRGGGEVARGRASSLRQMRKRDMEAEVGRFMEVYNEAWGHNWGFVPITEAEVAFQAKNLKPVLDENWAMIAEKDGEVVGAALTLPDVEQALAKMNGRLLPFGWWHFLRRKPLHRPAAGVRARGQGRLPAPRRRRRAL